MRKLGVRILFFLGVGIAGYVLYAHIASLRATAVLLRSTPRLMRFSEPASFAREIDVDKTAEYSVEPAVGALFIRRGSAGGAAGHATLRSHPFHFDGGLVRMRFRVMQRGPYDVFVGLESQARPDKRLWMVLRNDVEKPSFDLEGTDTLRGPTPPETESLLQYVEGPAIIRGKGEWHTMALRFEETSQTAEVFVDDVPVASRPVGWAGGFDANLVFGVRDREASEVEVEVAELAWSPQDGRARERGFDFEDQFVDGRIDPLHWQAFFQQEWRAGGELSRDETGHGLRLRGRGLSQSAPGIMTPVEVCTLPFSLTPLRVEIDWDARKLENASVYLSIRNLGGSRAVEVELANSTAGKNQLLIKGQLDGKIKPEISEGPPLPMGEVHLTASYDPWLRTLKVSNDDVKIFEHTYGLRREENVRICVGEHVFPEGESDVVLRRINVHRAPY